VDTPPDTSIEGSTYVYKVVLIGDGAVGKTNLRRRYMGEGFVAEYLNTVGADFAYFSEKVGKDLYKWSIWDLAGQPFYAGAFGALLCFDTTRYETFQNLDKWVDELARHTHTEGTPIVLVATKMDIYDSDKHINFDEVEEYRKTLSDRLDNRFDIGFIKTSSVTGLNVKEAFAYLRKSIGKWQNEEDT
jgi:Ras-related protein Rab-11A